MKSQLSQSSVGQNQAHKQQAASPLQDSSVAAELFIANDAGIADHANNSSQNHLSMYSDDNNQTFQQEDLPLYSHQSAKSSSKENSNNLDEQKDEGIPMVRASRKIKKDYRNLSLASKYEIQEQNEVQSSASKKKKLTNSGTKQKKKKQENEINSISPTFQLGFETQQQLPSKAQNSQSQTSPKVKQFKSQIIQSFQKFKTQLPPKMFSFLQKQTHINLNTVSKVSIRLPKNEEYSESMNNIQKVLEEQESIVKDLVGAQSSQSLHDFLTKQSRSKKEQLALQQHYAKQKYEEAAKDNIEQLKQNLQYKINPQFIKSELKKERKLSKTASGMKSPQSGSKMTSFSQSQQQLIHQQSHNNCFEMEVENNESQYISTELRTINNKDNDKKVDGEIQSNNQSQNIKQKDKQITKKQNQKKQSSLQNINEGNQQEGGDEQSQIITCINNDSTKYSNEVAKKNQPNNSQQNTASSTPTASQIIGGPYGLSPTGQLLSSGVLSSSSAIPQMNNNQQINYGNGVYQQRYPLRQQTHPSDHPYYMYYRQPSAQQMQQCHQRYQDKSHSKYYNQYANVTADNFYNSNPNQTALNSNESTLTEPTSSTHYLIGENQENIYHSTPNHSYYNVHPHPLYVQHASLPINNPYPYEYHATLKKDHQILNNSMRLNRNGSNHQNNFYQTHYPPHPSSTPSHYPLPDYQNSLGTHFQTDLNEQTNLSLEHDNNQTLEYPVKYNEKEQTTSNIETNHKREDFFNELDQGYEDSLSNFNIKSNNRSKKSTYQQGIFDIESQDQYSQNLMDFS